MLSNDFAGYRVHYNSDFSQVKIVLTDEVAEKIITEVTGIVSHYTVELPIELLRAIVAEDIRTKRIEILEQATPDQVLDGTSL